MKHTNATIMDSINNDLQDNCDDANQNIFQDIQVKRNSQSEPPSTSKKKKNFNTKLYLNLGIW